MLWISIGFNGFLNPAFNLNADPGLAFYRMRIRIQGAKQLRIQMRILVKIFRHKLNFYVKNIPVFL